MRQHTFETIIGVAVLLFAAVALVSASRFADIPTVDNYKLTASFDNVEGILVGSDVKIGGIKIGSVIKQQLDKENYIVTVIMNIDKAVKIPQDSSVKIATSGLIGDKFLAIEPGADEEMLQNGDEIIYTQSVILLEELISKFIFKTDVGN